MDELVPAFMPFTCHWYWGPGPGFWAAAVKLTVAPAHTGLAEAVMVTETGRLGVTVSWMTLEVAGLAAAQNKSEVRMQDTRSLSDGR